MEEEEKGISIGEIFKVIFKRIWWVVAVTAAVMIAFICVIQFWYNATKQQYTASFDIRLTSDDKYPDGTVLKVEDSILLENLQLIKDEAFLPEEKRTGKFSGIDIEKMVAEDGITLIRTIEAKADETYEYHNTLKISKKYFKNTDQAVSFVKAVAEFSVDNAKYIVKSMNYSERLSRYDRYLTYEEKIAALTEQREYIIGTYNEIKNLYSGEYVPAGLTSAKTIDDYIRDLTDVFDSRQQEAVSNTVSANYYVYDLETFIKNADANIAALGIEIKEINTIIANLREERDSLISQGILATEAYDVRMAELTETMSNKQIEKSRTEKTREEIAKYTEGDGKAAKDAFDAELDSIRAQLEQYTQTMKEVNVATYEEKSQTIYVKNKIVVEGGLNIILAALIGAVVGFVAVSAVILIIDLPKYKRQKLAAQEEKVQEISEQTDGEEKE